MVPLAVVEPAPNAAGHSPASIGRHVEVAASRRPLTFKERIRVGIGVVVAVIFAALLWSLVALLIALDSVAFRHN